MELCNLCRRNTYCECFWPNVYNTNPDYCTYFWPDNNEIAEVLINSHYTLATSRFNTIQHGSLVCDMVKGSKQRRLVFNLANYDITEPPPKKEKSSAKPEIDDTIAKELMKLRIPGVEVSPTKDGARGAILDINGKELGWFKTYNATPNGYYTKVYISNKVLDLTWTGKGDTIKESIKAAAGKMKAQLEEIQKVWGLLP